MKILDWVARDIIEKYYDYYVINLNDKKLFAACDDGELYDIYSEEGKLLFSNIETFLVADNKLLLFTGNQTHILTSNLEPISVLDFEVIYKPKNMNFYISKVGTLTYALDKDFNIIDDGLSGLTFALNDKYYIIGHFENNESYMEIVDKDYRRVYRDNYILSVQMRNCQETYFVTFNEDKQFFLKTLKGETIMKIDDYRISSVISDRYIVVKLIDNEKIIDLRTNNTILDNLDYVFVYDKHIVTIKDENIVTIYDFDLNEILTTKGNGVSLTENYVAITLNTDCKYSRDNELYIWSLSTKEKLYEGRGEQIVIDKASGVAIAYKPDSVEFINLKLDRKIECESGFILPTYNIIITNDTTVDANGRTTETLDIYNFDLENLYSFDDVIDLKSAWDSYLIETSDKYYLVTEDLNLYEIPA